MEVSPSLSEVRHQVRDERRAGGAPCGGSLEYESRAVAAGPGACGLPDCDALDSGCCRRNGSARLLASVDGPRSDTDPHDYANVLTDTHANGYADEHTDSHRNGDRHPHRDPDGYADTDGDDDWHRDADADPYGNADADTDRHRDRNSDENRNADTHSDGNSNAH